MPDQIEPQTPQPAGNGAPPSAPTAPPANETADQKAARLEAENAKLVSERDMQYGRATRAEAQLKERGNPASPAAPAAPAPGGSGTGSLDDVERRIEEKADLRHEGYSKAEIAEIETYAKAKGVSLKDAAELPFVKAAIGSLRAEQRSKEATPSSTSRGAQPAKVEEISKLKPDERKAQHNFEAWRDRKRQQARR